MARHTAKSHKIRKVEILVIQISNFLTSYFSTLQIFYSIAFLGINGISIIAELFCASATTSSALLCLRSHNSSSSFNLSSKYSCRFENSSNISLHFKTYIFVIPLSIQYTKCSSPWLLLLSNSPSTYPLRQW